MNLHEYQSKHLFQQYGMPVPNNRVVSSAGDVPAALDTLDTDRWVVKAQVHAGGRGKAGGVKLTDNKEEVAHFVGEMLGTNLVTFQTDDKGQPINHVLIEETCNIEKEFYLGAVIDRATRHVVIMASTEGGVEIEKVAEESPEKILRTTLDPMLGLMPFQCRKLAFGLGLKGDQVKQFTKLLAGLAKLFIEKDLGLVEINPLVVTREGNLLCLDGKINVDDNAIYRQPELMEMRDASQEDERENRAKEWDLNYIALEGSIGCMVNGAGLAMATMDLIKLHGGDPANFLDVGGGATKERVAEAFKIILSDTNVKTVMVNIFGGIVRCDLIAEGIIGAIEEVGVEVPIVVRLEGNNAKLGSKLLKESGLNIIAATGLTDAAKRAVAAAKGSK
ncbi:MAG: ADP-forming succinate--CoA ligase subunit beta [endosymbiont of Galathealinum brachiosum]|uniref:Succinate--CoA ligase [ADP-forming] subunit beta n=1 Tax=endosymbiont of Galathealinum brachiosum TaxID=2200906 RepID=A0A370DBS7_9GAMM|nr:MAG: ADP-forming succinate--CoA ligase subunit beta [endosymbiont of Galathealinum brachiosum]